MKLKEVGSRPQVMSYGSDFLNHLENLNREGVEYVVITLLKIVGSAPQNEGAKLVITRDKILWGTIGGGKIEAAALLKAQEILDSESSTEVIRWNLQSDIKMSCGGEVILSFEAHRPTALWSVALFGAGHVGQKFIEISQSLNVRLLVFDHRREWLDRAAERLKSAIRVDESESLTAESLALLSRSHPVVLVLTQNSKELVSLLTPQHQVVVMTMGHSTDLPIVEQALKQDFSFVGVMGSEIKSSKMKKELTGLGISSLHLNKLKCPVGKKLHSNQPEHIALTVWNQLLEFRDSSN